MNRQKHADAARLLAEDVELVFPGSRLKGREAWLDSRERQHPPEHLVEEVVADQVTETAQGAELTGRVIQRWVETGEMASELPLRIEFTITDGLIGRLEFRPG